MKNEYPKSYKLTLQVDGDETIFWGELIQNWPAHDTMPDMLHKALDVLLEKRAEYLRDPDLYISKNT